MLFCNLSVQVNARIFMWKTLDILRFGFIFHHRRKAE